MRGRWFVNLGQAAFSNQENYRVIGFSESRNEKDNRARKRSRARASFYCDRLIERPIRLKINYPRPTLFVDATFRYRP